MKILVTGADGFIGRNLIKYLSLKGCYIYANTLSENTITKHLCSMPSVEIVQAPICRVAEYINSEIDVCFHLAWEGVTPDLRKDFQIQISNIQLSIDCIKQAQKLGVKRMIFPGSTSEYLYNNEKITNKPIPAPIDAYGSVKVATRFLAESACEQAGIQFVYPIITGIYSEDRRDNNVIFYTIDKLLKGEKPRLSLLEQRWDYIHIADVVHALYLLAHKELKGKVYPIGHGDNWPLKKYIYLIRDIIDPSLTLGIGEIPYNEEIPASVIDLEPIYRDTGFIPRISYEEGIRKMIKKVKQGQL